MEIPGVSVSKAQEMVLKAANKALAPYLTKSWYDWVGYLALAIPFDSLIAPKTTE